MLSMLLIKKVQITQPIVYFNLYLLKLPFLSNITDNFTVLFTSFIDNAKSIFTAM